MTDRGLQSRGLDLGGGTSSRAPLLAVLAVVGVDGHYLVTITNPTDAKSAMSAQAKQIATASKIAFQGQYGSILATTIHEVQYANDLNFNADSGLKTLGGAPSTKTSYDITAPNEQRYWRLRSRFPGSGWTDWQILQDTATCGAALVGSGLLRDSSLSMVATAYNGIGANPLTQSGTTTQINAAASSWSSGTGSQLNYNSGSVDPGSYGTFYVYANDPRKQGGSVTYIAATNGNALTADDSVVYFGKITTSAGGGGTGGGGGSCNIAGVMIEKPDGSEAAAETFRKGDEVRNISGGIDRLVSDPEVAGNVPCFRITCENGVAHKGCSSSHSIQYDGGGFEFAFDLHVGDRIRTKLGPSAIATKEFIGSRTVYKFHLDNDTTFWADRIASHNNKAAPP